jgi:hypothetical protein
MDLRVHLKICEGCGCLWIRPQGLSNVYCAGCARKLRDYPVPESRKRRGRPPRMTAQRPGWAVAGGAQ